MSEFKDHVPHTGGVLTIHKQARGYSLSYHHMNPNAAGLVELIAAEGKAVDSVPITGMSLNRTPPPRALRVMLATDAEGMYGRECPKCHSYFRTSHPFTELCPYCDAAASEFDFFTSDQRAFVKRQYEAILTALAGDDGDTKIDFDAQIAQPDCKDSWIYSDERQQTRFRCQHCRLQCDVLGEYVRCPQCGTRTARDVVARKLEELSQGFEKDSTDIPKQERERRQRQWRSYIVLLVAMFEALGRDVAGALARLPCVPGRRKAVLDLSFQRLMDASQNLSNWFAIDLLRQLAEDDKRFLCLMVNRRHLFAHCDGRVDQEYLDKTGDSTVRLNEVVSIHSGEVRRLIALVTRIVNNLLDGFDSITLP